MVLQFVDRMPRCRDTDCFKNSEKHWILGGRLEFGQLPYFVTFWFGRPKQPGWPAGCSWHSGGNQHLQEENTSEEQREASHWTFARTVRRCFATLNCYKFSWRLHFSRCPYFMDTYILLTLIFSSVPKSIFGFIASVNVVYMWISWLIICLICS